MLSMCLLIALFPIVAAAADADGNTKNLQTVEVTAEHIDGYNVQSTSTANKLDLSPRETPQSISAVTRQQMDDFGLDSINDVLNASTGVTVESIETDRTYYTARGFDVTNFQVDGLGLPFTYGLQDGDIDTAIYDRIDILRGANGLLSSTGNPSATINFVRKRPTAEFQGSVGVTVGSWDNYRLDVDLSGPLNSSGSVRGRAVAAIKEGDSYLDRYSLDKQVFSGIVEADITPTTRLAAGVAYQKNSPQGVLWGALPLYHSDGTATDFDVSTSTAADWSFWDTTDTRVFAELTQSLGEQWVLKATINYGRKKGESELFYVYGTPDRDTGLGLFSYPSAYDDDNRDLFGDLYLAGSFALAGRAHDLVIGANAGRRTTEELSWYGNDIGTPLPALEDWNGDYPKPSFDAFSQGSDFDMRRQSLYATARWNLADSFKLITGANLTHVESSGLSYGTAHDFEDTRTTPFVGTVYDFAPQYSWYASYAKIFNPQVELDADFQVLDPLTGDNLETGIKGEWFDQRLNGSIAVFRTRQNNAAESAGFDTTTGLTYYEGVNAKSTGFELELAGRVAPGWDISTGYTQLRLKGDDGQDVRTYVPRRIFRLATAYRIPQLPGLRVGATLRWQDDIHRDQDAIDSNGNTIVIRQESYALLGLMAGCEFGDRWDATFNIDNVTDEKYVPSLYWDQGYYGAPRNASLTLRYRF